jgi:hypothetical protein
MQIEPFVQFHGRLLLVGRLRSLVASEGTASGRRRHEFQKRLPMNGWAGRRSVSMKALRTSAGGRALVGQRCAGSLRISLPRAAS